MPSQPESLIYHKKKSSSAVPVLRGGEGRQKKKNYQTKQPKTIPHTLSLPLYAAKHPGHTLYSREPGIQYGLARELRKYNKFRSWMSGFISIMIFLTNY